MVRELSLTIFGVRAAGPLAEWLRWSSMSSKGFNSWDRGGARSCLTDLVWLDNLSTGAAVGEVGWLAAALLEDCSESVLACSLTSLLAIFVGAKTGGDTCDSCRERLTSGRVGRDETFCKDSVCLEGASELGGSWISAGSNVDPVLE
jgi:hypothetical protein